MSDDESSGLPRQAKTIGDRLLMKAERSPELRAQLIERWARAATWNRVEGIALAWTIDPRGFITKSWREETLARELPEEAKHYFDLARRDPDLKMPYNHVTPSRFIAWAHDVGLAFHPDWHNAVSQARSDASSRPPQTGPDRTRERLIAAWARSPYWSPEEAAVLAYDLDPKDAVEHSTTGYDAPSLRAPADARQLLSFAHRAIEVGTLDEKPAPRRFMEWARSIGVEFHPEWWNAVVDDAAEDERAAAQSPPPLRELKAREQESLLKLVAGMAIGAYKWDPSALRQDVTTEIADDLRRAGVELNPDTIRKWLRQSADHIERDQD